MEFLVVKSVVCGLRPVIYDINIANPSGNVMCCLSLPQELMPCNRLIKRLAFYNIGRSRFRFGVQVRGCWFM